jgi:hypothetical protein
MKMIEEMDEKKRREEELKSWRNVFSCEVLKWLLDMYIHAHPT